MYCNICYWYFCYLHPCVLSWYQEPTILLLKKQYSKKSFFVPAALFMLWHLKGLHHQFRIARKSLKTLKYRYVETDINFFELAPLFYIDLWSSYASALKSFKLSFLFWIHLEDALCAFRSALCAIKIRQEQHQHEPFCSYSQFGAFVSRSVTSYRHEVLLNAHSNVSKVAMHIQNMAGTVLFYHVGA